jgi:Glyoxalase-like domain
VDVRWMWAFLDLPEDGFEDAVRFWCTVTRSSLSAPRGSRGQFATLLPDRGEPWVKVQRLDEGPRVHVDLDVEGPLSPARDEVVALGGTVVLEHDDVVVCRSPGGFTFCLTTRAPGESAGGQVRSGSGGLLDQVCLDIPRRWYEAEVAFWSALTGWERYDDQPDEFERLRRDPRLPLQVLLQRLDDEDGPVRAHVDFASADMAAEVAHHVQAGARVVGPGRGWTVLDAPGGLRYCVTARPVDTSG